MVTRCELHLVETWQVSRSSFHGNRNVHQALLIYFEIIQLLISMFLPGKTWGAQHIYVMYHLCSTYPHTSSTTAGAQPKRHQYSLRSWRRSIRPQVWCLIIQANKCDSFKPGLNRIEPFKPSGKVRDEPEDRPCRVCSFERRKHLLCQE